MSVWKVDEMAASLTAQRETTLRAPSGWTGEEKAVAARARRGRRVVSCMLEEVELVRKREKDRPPEVLYERHCCEPPWLTSISTS